MKRIIIAIIITAVICISGTAIAVTQINASDIKYDDNNSVKDKIDDLYNVAATWKNLSTTTTATPSDLLSGKTAYNSDGELITGSLNTSMPSQFSFSIKHSTLSSYCGSDSVSSFDLPSSFAKFKITEVISAGSAKSCSIYAYSSDQQKWITLSVNAEYSVKSVNDGYKFTTISVGACSTSNNTYSRCNAKFVLYN